MGGKVDNFTMITVEVGVGSWVIQYAKAVPLYFLSEKLIHRIVCNISISPISKLNTTNIN